MSSLPFAGGEEASEARPGWQSPGNTGWRARARGVVKAAPSGHSSMEGALGRESRCPLTRRRRKRSWLSTVGFGPSGFGDRGRQKVDSHSPSVAENATAEVRRNEGPSIGGTHQERAAHDHLIERWGTIVRGSSEAGSVTSNALSLESCAGALVPSHVMRSARARRSPRESNVRQVLVSRIGCRSRKDASSSQRARGVERLSSNRSEGSVRR